MITAALIGSPNAGKTTVFNKLTGSIQHVGNWPGVTVERKQGYIRGTSKDRILVVDLPGIYSLSPYSPEEIVSRDYLIGTSESKPDVAINILDASNLERGMYLLMQVSDLGLPMVIVLNMMDVAEQHGITIDVRKLSETLGCEVVETVAMKSKGIDRIADAVQRAYDSKHAPKTITYAPEVEETITKLSAEIKNEVRNELVRWCSIKLIERDQLVIGDLPSDVAERCEAIVKDLEAGMDDDGVEIMASQRYFASERIKAECAVDVQSREETWTDKVDKVLLNKWASIPIFIVVMFAVYYISIQTIGVWGTDWMNDIGVAWTHETVENWMHDNEVDAVLIGVLAYGIVDGVGAVAGFVPQIIVLFFCLALLEECGYMARVAYLLDKIFVRFGLSGKTVIPVVIGTGCGVPGVMASRTIEDEQTRRITAMTTTFIPCSAKLPIITVIIAAFVPNQYSAITALLCYLLGIFMILLSGTILKKFKGISGKPSPFVMELPVYHEPTVRSVLTSTSERSWSFVRKAGTFILLAVVIVWFLSSFDWGLNYLAEWNETDGAYDFDTQKSMLADMGNAVTWVFYPQGFGNHWELTVSSITGLLAKENLLGTVTVLTGLEADSDDIITSEALAGFCTAGQAYAFLIFNLLCAPCFAAIGAMHRELGTWRATGFAVLYQCVLAYIASMTFYAIWSLATGEVGLSASSIANLAVSLALCCAVAFFAIVNNPVGKLKERLGRDAEAVAE